MKTDQAVHKMTEVIRRKHLARSTERSYRAWLRRYCDYLLKVPGHLTSEQKLERFLTALATEGVAASTQNQAFNAIVFFYQEVAWGAAQFMATPGPIPAVPEGHLKLAQHFSAGAAMGKPQVPPGTAAPVADDSVVPAGLAGGITTYPALKCWAILRRPSGTGRSVPRRCQN